MRTNGPLRIVAAVDLDDTLPATWTTATMLLANPDAELSVVHVVPAVARDVRKDAAAMATVVGEAHQRVQDAVARELGSEANPLRARIDVYIALGDPATQIVQTAVDLDADLVVVGTHDRRGFERLILGAVSSEVFRRAPCSVLVARASDHAAREAREKTPSIAPPATAGERPFIPGPVVRYRSRPFSTYNANLFPTGIPRGQVR
jgi:nucleotide-binding universal stress UspA family protein